jgi:hypothetical protein
MRRIWQKAAMRFSAAYLILALWTPAFWFLGVTREHPSYVDGPYIAAAVGAVLFVAPIITLFFLRDLAALKRKR